MMSMTHTEKGFTLVELAISLMIIGLLLGGVLKGDELIKNARITSTIKQVQDYTAALANFRTTYDAMPGDMLNPGTRLQNCTGTCATSGDANNVIDSSGYFSTMTYIGLSVNTEMLNAPTHLVKANMLSGRYSTKATAVTVMTTPMGASTAFTIKTTVSSTYNGHYLVLMSIAGTDTVSLMYSSTNYGVTPNQAALLDRKMDDGNGLQGDVQSIITTAPCQDSTTGAYQNSDTLGCTMVFKIGKFGVNQ